MPAHRYSAFTVGGRSNCGGGPPVAFIVTEQAIPTSKSDLFAFVLSVSSSVGASGCAGRATLSPLLACALPHRVQHHGNKAL